MARFRFQLEPVLKARRHAERARQRVVASLEGERLGLERRIRGHQDAIASSRRLLREQIVGRLDVHMLRGESAVAVAAMRQAQQLVLELAGVHKRLEAARGELIEATRARRAIELLRERRFEAWRKAQEKAEQNLLDELAGRAVAAAETVSCAPSGTH